MDGRRNVKLSISHGTHFSFFKIENIINFPSLLASEYTRWTLIEWFIAIPCHALGVTGLCLSWDQP